MPATLEFGNMPVPVDPRALVLFGLGLPDGRGRFVHDSGSGEVVLKWKADADARSLGGAVMGCLDRIVTEEVGSVSESTRGDRRRRRTQLGAGRQCQRDGG